MESGKKAEPRQYSTPTEAVWACKKIGGNNKLVALCLVKHWPNKTPSQGEIAEECGIGVRTLQACLTKLQEKAVITTVRQQGSRSTYNFPGVSIPDLGAGADLPPESGPSMPGTYADSAGVPTPILRGSPTPILRGSASDKNSSPLSRDLRSGGRGARASARGTPPARDLSSTKKIDTPECACCSDRQGLEHPLVGWVMPAELHAQLVSRRLTPDRIAYRMRNLLNIRGAGQGRRCLSVYVNEQADKWVRWEGEEGLLAPDPNCCAGKGSRIDFPAELVKRCAGWTPGAPSIALAAGRVDIVEQFSRYVRSGRPRELGLSETFVMDHARGDVERDFMKHLQRVLAQQQRDGAAA